MSDDPANTGSLGQTTYQVSSENTPDLVSTPAVLSHNSLPSVEGTPAFYVDTANEGRYQALVETTIHESLGPDYPSAGLEMDSEEFKWFAPQPELFLVGNPAAAAESSGYPSSLTGDGSVYNMPALPLEAPLAPEEHSRAQRFDADSGRQKSCLCDPSGLSIISELHSLQSRMSPLDSALLLARRGLGTVSSYLTCPSCSNYFSTSPSMFLACVLILQQVFACYINLRMQDSRMLSGEKRADSTLSGSSICIGDFEVQGEEGCSALVDAIVRSEIERGKGVIGHLEQWAKDAGEGREHMAGMLLQSLRQEIGGVC